MDISFGYIYFLQYDVEVTKVVLGDRAQESAEIYWYT